MPAGTLPGGVTLICERLCAFCLCDCKRAVVGSRVHPVPLFPGHGWVSLSCPSQGLCQPENYCPVMGTDIWYLPWDVKEPAPSCPFQGARAKSGLPTGPAQGLWQLQLGVLSGPTDHKQSLCSTAWELYRFRLPCSF